MLDQDLVPTSMDTPHGELLLMWDASVDSVNVWCPHWDALSLSVWGAPLKTLTAASWWIKLVAQWPSCPQHLHDASDGVRDSSSDDYLQMALEFFVSEFTSKYSRLLTLPPCAIEAERRGSEGEDERGREERKTGER